MSSIAKDSIGMLKEAAQNDKLATSKTISNEVQNLKKYF